MSVTKKSVKSGKMVARKSEPQKATEPVTESVIDEVRKVRRGQPKLIPIGFGLFKRCPDGHLEMYGVGISTPPPVNG
jgi:hypothetical protein